MQDGCHQPMSRGILFWDDRESRTPCEQMALDEALLLRAEMPVVRFYRWTAPAVTFGYAQRHAEVQALAGGHPCIRRWTGGGVVFHGSDLTIALAVPGRRARDGRKSDEIYRGIHLAILKVVQQAFPEARLAGEDDCRPGAACFQSPALHDILFHGKKICGGALRRGRDGILYQGSLHADLLPADLAAALSTPVAGFCGGAEEESRRPDFLPACDPPTCSGAAAEEFTPDVETLRFCATLAEEKYGTEKWNKLR